MSLNLESLKKALMNWLALLVPIVSFISSIIAYTFSKQYSKKVRASLIILAFLLSYFVALNVLQQENYKMTSSTSGEISSVSKDIEYPCILFGSGDGNGITFSSNRTSLIPIGYGNDVPVKVWIENGQLKVSTTVRDKDGKILAIMNANEWNTAKQPQILDRNFDENAVEVIDAYNRVVLQVSMSEKCANIQGIFYNEDGSAFVIFGPGIGMVRPGEKISAAIDPIFIYPSDRHLGERRNRE
jgi:hypothetical protein